MTIYEANIIDIPAGSCEFVPSGCIAILPFYSDAEIYVSFEMKIRPLWMERAVFSVHPFANSVLCEGSSGNLIFHRLDLAWREGIQSKSKIVDILPLWLLPPS